MYYGQKVALGISWIRAQMGVDELDDKKEPKLTMLSGELDKGFLTEVEVEVSCHACMNRQPKTPLF